MGSAAPRIAYLSYSSGLFDARTFRMARWAVAAGFEVTVYARWEPGLPFVEERDGYRLVRAPWDWRQLLPRRRRVASSDRAADAAAVGGWSRADQPPERAVRSDPASAAASTAASPAGSPRTERSTLVRLAVAPVRAARRWLRLLVRYPVLPLGWARALEDVAEPADIWHGMWAGSLPALVRLRRRHGGLTVYDSRDVYMESRHLATSPRPLRAVMGWFERRWARRADRIITVNASYARLLAARFGVPEPPVVMNCPDAWEPPVPRPDLIRAALDVPADTHVVLYQGQLISDRGIEQAMDAILEVPDAVLVLLGFGAWVERYRAMAATPPYHGRVHLLPAVDPSELVAWTASADVMVMPIQPTSLNHRFTTPQKLFESIAAGVPVVASNLPGMAEVVLEIGAGALCDPTSPASIGAALRTVLALDPAELVAMRARIIRAAHERYNWGQQVAVLAGIYRDLSPKGEPVGAR